MIALRSRLPLIALTGAVACNPPPIDMDTEGAALMQLSREWSDVTATGNVDSILSYWADDAIVLPPGRATISGKAAIREFVEGMNEIPDFEVSWEPISVHIAASGDLAYMVERNTTSRRDSTGATVRTYGKVITVWRKDDTGAWKSVVDMWNEAPPPAGG